MNREIRDMIENAEAQGFRIEYRGGTVLVYAKEVSKGFVTLHSTPSDHRGIRNARSYLRRIGVVL